MPEHGGCQVQEELAAAGGLEGHGKDHVADKDVAHHLHGEARDPLGTHGEKAHQPSQIAPIPLQESGHVLGIEGIGGEKQTDHGKAEAPGPAGGLQDHDHQDEAQDIGLDGRYDLPSILNDLVGIQKEIDRADEAQDGEEEVIPWDLLMNETFFQGCDEKEEGKKEGDQEVIIGIAHHDPQKTEMIELVDGHEDSGDGEEDEYPPQRSGQGSISASSRLYFLVSRGRHLPLLKYLSV